MLSDWYGQFTLLLFNNIMNHYPTNIEKDLLHSREYGRERREFLLRFLHKYGKIYVNKKHQLQTNQDKDLQWLLKKNKIKICRESSYRIFKTPYATKRTTCGQSYIRLFSA